MSYAGNPSLSSDIQKRVLGTFEQTLGLAAEGNRQEALLGCDFVLRMDSQFEPARRLQERLRDSTGPVRVDDLLAPAADDPFAGAINLDLPDLPAFEAPAAGPGDLHGRFQSSLEARRFQELLTLAHQQQEAVGRDPELMRMATAAQERMEAEPYVNKFLAAAQEAARLGQRDEVARLSEKIRALDPSHPGLAALSAAPSTPAAPAARAADAADATAADAAGMGFEMNFDDPAGSLDLGTDLPDLGFDTPSLDLSLDELAVAPALDPELVSAADFASSMGGAESETDRRIRELLNEGQRAQDGGDLQGAIDAWSRIFLIDIDHQEAARRIDQARKVKAESERQAEEIFHEGIAKIEAGDLQGAKKDLQRVLEIQPSYFAAREYLQQLEAGHVPVIKPVQRESSPQPALPRPSDLDLETAELKEEILIPPDPSEVAAAERQRAKPRPIGAPAREGRARKLFVMVGSAVLVLALAGGGFVYLNRDKLFPNSQADESALAGPAIMDPIGRAAELQKSGKTQSALSQLKRIPPSDPAYPRAQELIKEWSVTAAPAAPAGPAAVPAMPAGTAPPIVSPERLAILTAAREAYQGGNYLEAARRLEQASSQGQLEPADAEMLASAKRQTEPLAAQINLFRQHEWEHALRDLWRMHEADPANRDVTRLMVDSYYNLGLRDLQRMDSAKAIENFNEAAGLDPNDQGLRRQLAFAQTYQERPKDLLYRIYVKHLPLR